jgi:hypothetical protein
VAVLVEAVLVVCALSFAFSLLSLLLCLASSRSERGDRIPTFSSRVRRRDDFFLVFFLLEDEEELASLMH